MYSFVNYNGLIEKIIEITIKVSLKTFSLGFTPSNIPMWFTSNSTKQLYTIHTEYKLLLPTVILFE